MLIEFSVENYRFIKEQMTLSMVATKDNSLENNLIHIDSFSKDEWPSIGFATVTGIFRISCRPAPRCPYPSCHIGYPPSRPCSSISTCRHKTSRFGSPSDVAI